ncbi:hypothetical protein FA13DRAFT_1737811 [Coprinellus micaceus]|uniref:Uncharacterized protein n=1 Tax=Coprinellus micaceus TaxID=71717 RepID=A0A4Y7SVK8_COPMI|nr:hypothetical protein FA13DRAFT_1737811 [Coprinellus micaceus]
MSPIERAREDLCNRGEMYMGDPKNLEELTWVTVRVGHDQVVQKGRASPAVLYAIVYISKDDYRMTPCSDWDPYYEGFGIGFEKAKANAIAQDPAMPELQGDFLNVCTAIDVKCAAKLQEDSAGHGLTHPLRRPWRSSGPWTGFRIQHRLFRNTGAWYGDWQEDPDPQFRIENWPVNWPAEGTELTKILGSHVVVPLPAEDVDGNRIHPLHYEEKLSGAVIRVGFVMNHYFPLNGKHRFTADIDNIRVLVPPTPEPPVRERIARNDSNAGNVKVKREGDVTPAKERVITPPTPKRKRVVEQGLDESDVEVKHEEGELPLAKKQKLSATAGRAEKPALVNKATHVVKKEEED